MKKRNIVILLLLICLIILSGSSLYSGISGDYRNHGRNTIGENLKDISSAISLASKERGEDYYTGECVTEGHIILDVEKRGDTLKVYTLASNGTFGFENGIFTKISGSGAIPTVMLFSINENEAYSLVKYKQPMDGSEYVNSIKKMFPRRLHNRALNAHKEYPKLAKQQEEQAKQYLTSIGREAKVTAYHVEKKLKNINVEASNKLTAELTKYDEFLNNCPYWLGTREKIEDGVRYIYETSQGKTNDGYDLITFRKTEEDGTIVEERNYKIVGAEPKLMD